MNSKQRGLSPFKAKVPDRLPMWYGAAPETTQNIMKYVGARSENEALYEILGIDYKTIRPRYIGKPFKEFDDGTVENEWGLRRAGYHWGQAVNHPLGNAESIRDIEKYRFPNPDDWDVKISNEELMDAEGFCVIGGTWAPFFHDAAELIGMEQFFIKMYEDPGLIEALIEKCFEFYYEINIRVFKTNPGVIDMYFMGNDFGSQRGLLMSPQLWRRFFKPRLCKMIDLAHKNGAITALHSCGDIHEILPDLIDIGLDAINPIQVFAENMDPEVLKREYGKDIVFFGGIDVNEILRLCIEEDVRRETRRIIDILGYDGKYIVAASHDYLLPEIPAANIVAMYDEAKKYSTGK